MRHVSGCETCTNSFESVEWTQLSSECDVVDDERWLDVRAVLLPVVCHIPQVHIVMLIIICQWLIVGPLEGIFNAFVDPIRVEVYTLKTPLITLSVNTILTKFMNMIDVVKEFLGSILLLEFPVEAVFSEVLQNNLSSVQRVLLIRLDCAIFSV